MPKFEVHIPANDQKSFSFTFRVDADGWTAALKAGMARLGQQGGGNQGQNMMVDVQDDNSLHVTDAESGRVFQIRELSEHEASTAVVKKRVPSPPPPTTPSVTPIPPPAPGFSTGAATIIESRANLPEHLRRELDGLPAAPAPTGDDEDEEDTDPSLHSARTVEELQRVETRRVAHQEVIPTKVGGQLLVVPVPVGPEPVTKLQRRGTPRSASPSASTGSGPRKVAVSSPLSPAPLGREPTTRRGAKPKGTGDLEVLELERPVRPITGTIGRTRSGQMEAIETMLSEVFERVQEVYAMADPSEALYFLLDLALEKIPSDAGSVLEADAQGDLRFSAARGPKAAELLEANLVVPSGSGIAGFCAHEGVTVALSDVQKDPRYYAEISRRVDYQTRSVLASPMMTHGRTFGCMQVLNKKDSPVFAVHEVGILSYIAHQAALYLNALS